jgi:hypothetical protein
MDRLRHTFTRESHPLPASLTEEPERIAAEILADEGYEIRHGLTALFAGQIIEMAATANNIRRFYPEDRSEERFGSDVAVKDWLANKGKGVFLMLQDREKPGRENIGRRLMGYAWVARETTAAYDDGKTEFAFRAKDEANKPGLTIPFAVLAVAAARKMFGANLFWAETWGSNTRALDTYRSVGFTEVSETPWVRVEPHRKRTPDSHVVMSLPE